MTYELHHSGILTGSVNCFCLACDSYLGSRQHALSHIGTSSHCDNLRAVPYLDTFKDQNIRKFKTGYYCEFCNYLMHTSVKVDLHIVEDNHKQNRGTNLLRSLHCDVVAFKDILIKERAWHGFTDNVCCICDVEFADEDHHKTDTSHLLNLTQNPVKFGMKDDIYRKIDDATVQCLTCNKLLPLNTIVEHFKGSEHLDLYAKCRIETNKESKGTSEKDDNENLIDIIALNDSNSKNINDNNMTVHHTTTYRGIEINYETATAFRKTCQIESKINVDDIEKHIELEKSPSALGSVNDEDNKHYNVSSSSQCNDSNDNRINDTLKEDPEVILCKDEPKNRQLVANNKFGQNDDSSNNFESGSKNSDVNDKEYSSTDVYQYAEDNHITYNPKANSAFCQICQVELPFNLKSMKEHIKGRLHNKNIVVTKAKMNHSQMETTVDFDDIGEDLKLKKSTSETVPVNDNDDNKYYRVSDDNDQSNDCSYNHINDTLKEDPEVMLSKDERKNRQLVASSKFTQNDDSSTNYETVSTNSDVNIKEHGFTDAHHYANDNDITYNQKASSAFCQICQVELPFNLKTMKEHVEGGKHNKKVVLTKAKIKSYQTRQIMHQFITSLFRTESIRHSAFDYESGYLLNHKYYINVLSFLLLARNYLDDGLTCILCGTILACSEIPVEHVDRCSLPLGKDLQFITSEPEEFIREIKAGIFHCGFCHTLVSSWSEMESHLRTNEHESRKCYSYQRFKTINSSPIKNIRIGNVGITSIKLNFPTNLSSPE